MKYRSAIHGERSTRVMSKHERRDMVRRFVSPPSLPVFVRPRTANWAEHVAAENPRADAGETLGRESVVDARFAVRHTLHPPPRSGSEEPLHQIRSIDTKRMLQILIGTGAQVLEGIEIASRSTIGAGAVVTSSIDVEGGTHVGVPAVRRK